MGMYRVYNENYYNFGDLSSVDFVEVDNTVMNCNNIYDPSVRNRLNIVNVKAADVANFIRTNKVLTPTQVLQLNNKWNQGDCTFMQPYQYEHQKIKDEIREADEQNTFDKLHGEDNMGCNNDGFMSMLKSFEDFVENARNTRQHYFYEPKNDDEDDFFASLVDAEQYCPTAVNANKKYEDKIKESWKKVPQYEEIRRTNGYTNEGRNMIDRETLDTGSFATSGFAIEPTPFDSKPFDFNIDVDSIFTSQPKKIDEATDVTNLDSINIDNSSLMQGSCLDMFNQTVEKIGDAKIREPEHTSPAKLEKQRRIEEYHKRHNRKKNR
jgi:hypothetical protein